ncbi:MAG: type II CAAX endopeptidase family protein [Haloferacaceae archaeon]
MEDSEMGFLAFLEEVTAGPISRRGLLRVTHGDDDERVRATWRGIVPWVVSFGGQIVLLVALVSGVRRLVTLSELDSLTLAIVDRGLFGVVSALGLLVAIAVATWLDGRPVSAYGIGVSRRDLTDWSAGTVIGLLTWAVPAVAFLQLGEAELKATVVSPDGALGTVAVFALVAVVAFFFQVAFEELAFRGVMLTNFAEGLSARRVRPKWAAVGALAVSSVIFGASHLITQGGGGVEGRSLQLLITSTLLGLLWGGAYVLSGRLSIPFGLHLGHNLWTAVALQPVDVELAIPALGRIAYSVSKYELTLGNVIVGAACLLAWLYATRGGLSIDLQ